MRSVRQLFILAMALIWVPLTAHCRIASLPGFEFLRCVANDSAHHDDDSAPGDDCACCVQEHSEYNASRWENLVSPQTHDLPLPFLENWILQPGLAPDESEGVLTAAPPPSPPLKSRWVFVLRLALPVRAPSLAS